jgi:hypothetical protein
MMEKKTMSEQKEFDLDAGGSVRFKVDGRTLLEITEDWVSYRGALLNDCKDVARTLIEFIGTMKTQRTASEVLFVLEGHKEKMQSMERRVRELEVINMKKDLELLAQQQEITSLKNQMVGVTVTSSGTTTATSWHAQGYSDIR